MNTHGVKVDLEILGLKRYTQQERRTAKEEKLTAAKEAKEAKALAKLRTTLHSETHIAAVEDQRACKQVERQSLRPDLDLQKRIPISLDKPAQPPKNKKTPKRNGQPVLC